MELTYVWAWLAVWLAWVWAAIWQWILAKKAMEVMWKTPSLTTFFLTVTILGIALVESVVIYWLVISFQLMDLKWIGLYSSISAWLAIWLAAMWSWIWEWFLISWALQAMNRNPEIKWKIMAFMVLFVALVEVVSIYWLIVALKITWTWIESPSFLWAWISIWVAWLWVAIWQWLLAWKSLELMGQNPKLISFFLTVSILGLALIESVVIYALIVSFKILDLTTLSVLASVWAWAAIWFAWLWAWVWEWLLIKWALEAINISPDTKWKSMAFMVLFVALVEVVAIYWLIVAFKILG